MTIKAVCTVGSVFRDPDDHSRFQVGVNYAVLTDDSIQGLHYVSDLSPSTLGSTLTDTIQAAMKIYLTGEGVSFGIGDSVRLIPGII